MNRIKTFLTGSLGIIGYILYCILTFIISYIPIYYLDFNFYLTIAIVILVELIPILSSIMPVFWIWALIESFSVSIGVKEIVLYVCFVISALPFIICLIIDIFSIIAKLLNKKNIRIILIAIFALLLIGLGISVTFNIIQYNENYHLKSKTSETEETLKEKTKLADYYKERFQFYFNECNNYQSEIYDLEDKSDFMDDYIEIVGVDEYYYHKYGCDYLDDSSFWAFNSEAAKSKGYHKCPHCH